MVNPKEISHKGHKGRKDHQGGIKGGFVRNLIVKLSIQAYLQQPPFPFFFVIFVPL